MASSENSANGSLHDHTQLQPGIATTGLFYLRLLGSFDLVDPFGQPIDISAKKNRLLLAMLACAPGRSMSRGRLSSLLWPEHGEEQARNSLRQALAVLRRDLKGQDAGFFSATEATITLHPKQVALDTEAFLAKARSETRQSLEAAVDLWRGPFLSDVRAGEPDLEQWLREQGEDYNSKHIVAMDRLAPMLEGQPRIDLAKRLVQADTLREASHRHLMEAYFAAGERPQALRHYENLRKLLKEELGVEPSPEIKALRERIAAAGHSASPASETAPKPSPLPAPAPLPLAEGDAAIPAAIAAVVSTPAAPARARIGRSASIVGAVLLIIASMAAVWFFRQPTPALAAPPSVAVLPFQTLSGDAGDARLAEGLTIDTITDLSRFQDFRVMAKDTMDEYKGKAVDIRALGKDLKVSHVLKGAFQREKDHIRITAQLIDAATGETLWSDRYDRLIGEIFAIQSDVADHIANSLGGRAGKVGESMLVNARRKPPADLDAYETYLLAQETMYSDLSDEHMKEAQTILDRVIAKDPTFARAYVRYANTYAWRFTYEGGAADLMQQMLVYARKAVSLDPMDADAHAALGYALTMTGEYKQGEAHLEEALRLTPNAFDILIFQSCLAPTAAKGAEAADRAIDINPSYPKWAVPCLRLALVLVGRYEDVIRVQSRQPEDEWNTDGYVIAAGSLATLGKKDEAAALVKRGVEKFPGLLSIERFALNRSWPPENVKQVEDLMRRAGFPACATSQDLADTPSPVRLPECKG